MTNIAICTFTRAEYGLLKRVIALAATQPNICLIAGGDHFSKEKGETIKEIYDDRLIASDKIVLADFIPDYTHPHAIAASVARGIGVMSDLLQKHDIGGLVLMGDRHELFAAAIPAMLHHVPVVHISGGEVTEGVIDDYIRHAITKMSHLHLVANDQCAEKLSLMGEEDWRIVITGEPGLDAIHHMEIADVASVMRDTGIDLNEPTILATLHPSTVDPGLTLEEQCTPFFDALKSLDRYHVIITAPGAEEGSSTIIRYAEELAAIASHVRYIPHLGSKNYLGVLRGARAVVGNSSSGIVEAPSLGTPSVNVGNRQKGRMVSEAVIHCGYQKDDIVKTILYSDTEAHRRFFRLLKNPYDPWGDGNNSQRAVDAIRHFFGSRTVEQQLVKKFDNQVNREAWNSLLK